MELLSTIDWLLLQENCEPTLAAVKEELRNGPAGKRTADRKLKLFNEDSLLFAINRQTNNSVSAC